MDPHLLIKQLDDFSNVITTEAVAEYLASSSWSPVQDLSFEQVWSAPDDTRMLLHLPKDRRLADYPLRFAQAIESLLTFYDWSLWQAAENLAATRSDVMFLRIDQSSLDGTIPLRQAHSLLGSVDQMVRSAAIVTQNPHASGRGRIPDSVTNFLDDDVRMGHTKRGSFIITVAARHDRPELQTSPQPTHPSPDPDPVSFSRAVMTTLAQSLSATKELVSHRTALDSAVEQGVRLPLVKALRSMGDSSEGLKSVDMKFEWSPRLPQQTQVGDQVVLSNNELQGLAPIEERLSLRDEPIDIDLVGPVTELRRIEEPDGREGGVIVITGEVEDRIRKVAVTLYGRDYDWAIRAHRARLPFSVSGVLTKSGRGWALLNPTADLSFLEFRLSDK